jgi:hypothetical protein
VLLVFDAGGSKYLNVACSEENLIRRQKRDGLPRGFALWLSQNKKLSVLQFIINKTYRPFAASGAGLGGR